MSHRPYAVAFDVLETLAEVDALRERFQEIGQPPDLLHPWFLRVQRDCMALALSGDFVPFDVVARQALRVDSGHTASERQIDHLLEGFAELPAYDDAEPALRRLARAGVRVGCLTVGDPERTARFLRRTGLAEYVDRVVTAQDVEGWKPSPAVYRAAGDALRTPLDRLALVAVHAWDCHGASRAGCLAGWCARLEGTHGLFWSPPDATGDDLVRVVERLLELPAD